MATKTLFVDGSGKTLELKSSPIGITLTIGDTAFLISDDDLPEFKAEMKAREKEMERLQEDEEQAATNQEA